uniref:Uncharacterized protein n=1 Tax=Tanacetum cinerariifolium TaxID=118510 RepID=A0A699H9L4_TANCI|nr:hypothetical protein [Tanacetum cinerariifolium]
MYKMNDYHKRDDTTKLLTLEALRPHLELMLLKTSKIYSKGFSKVETPLFEGGCIQTGGIIKLIDADKDVTLKEVEVDKNVEVEKDADVQGRPEESQAQIYKIDLEHADKVLSMQDDESESAELKKVVKLVITAKLMTEVVTGAAATITAAAPITAATITVAPSAARRRKGVVIRDLEKMATPSTIIHIESKYKDKVKGIMVQEPKPLKKQAQIEHDEAYKEDNALLRYQALKRKPQIEAQARKNIKIYLRNMAGFKMDYFKGMSYDDIRLIFNKEDLEVLWQLVKEIFASSKPKNFSDDFLLTILTYMFEKPDIEAQVWKNQRGVHGLAKTSKICSKGLLLLVKDLLLLVQVDAVRYTADIKLRLLEQNVSVGIR